VQTHAGHPLAFNTPSIIHIWVMLLTNRQTDTQTGADERSTPATVVGASNNTLCQTSLLYVERRAAEAAESDVRRGVVSAMSRWRARPWIGRWPRAGHHRWRLRLSETGCRRRVTSSSVTTFQQLAASRQVAQTSPGNFCTSATNCFSILPSQELWYRRPWTQTQT